MALWQMWSDWRTRMLPYRASLLAFGIAWSARWVHVLPPDTGGGWAVRWLLTGLVLTGGVLLWLREALGLGDVGSFAALTLGLGTDGLMVIWLGYVITAMGLGIGWLMHRRAPRAVPLGPGLWGASIVMWLGIMMVAR